MKGDNDIIVLMAFIILIVFLAVLVGSWMGNQSEKIPECSDGRDNDNDMLVDKEDPGCHTDLNADNDYSYDPERFSEYDREMEICKTHEDCLNQEDGTRCITVYPGDFQPFCGCMTDADCIMGSCGSDNKCS
ncbi:MAG: hypothetical protein ABIE55_04485 [Candidatus Aenigmatarchaeota archaeon]